MIFLRTERIAESVSMQYTARKPQVVRAERKKMPYQCLVSENEVIASRSAEVGPWEVQLSLLAQSNESRVPVCRVSAVRTPGKQTSSNPAAASQVVTLPLSCPTRA